MQPSDRASETAAPRIATGIAKLSWLRQLQVAQLGSKTWDWGLLLTGLPLCMATRAANIFPLSRLANLRRKLPLPHNLQVGGASGIAACQAPRPAAEHL